MISLSNTEKGNAPWKKDSGAFRYQKLKKLESWEKIAHALRGKPRTAGELKVSTGLSGTQLHHNLKQMCGEVPPLIETFKGKQRIIDKRRGEYRRDTTLYRLTSYGRDMVDNAWMIRYELDRMYFDIETDRRHPDCKRKFELQCYSGHSQSSPWGAAYYPYEVFITSKGAAGKPVETFHEIRRALKGAGERTILEIVSRLDPKDLSDINAEIFIGFHVKSGDLKRWLERRERASESGESDVKSPLVVIPGVPPDISALEPIREIKDENVLSTLDLAGLPIPEKWPEGVNVPVPLRSLDGLRIWFQSTEEGRNYFSKFAPKIYSSALANYMSEQHYKITGTYEGLQSWWDSEEGQMYEKLGKERFRKEEEEANKSRPPMLVGWEEIADWLNSADGLIYLKALDKAVSLPPEISSFIKRSTQ